MKRITLSETIEISMEIGKILLQNGSTANRVELMMCKVCKIFGYPQTEAFVTPTGIFLTVSDGKENITTSIKRIENRKTDLGKITKISHLVNEMEKQYCRDGLCMWDADKFRDELRHIENERAWPEWFTIFCGGLTSGCFCLLFGGSWLEFAVAYIVGVLVSLSLKLLGNLRLNSFLTHIVGAALIVVFAKVLDIWVPYIKLDNIIIGGIMLLVPGLSFVNAIRDAMSGDLVSGTARGIEAIMLAIAIAAGSGIMLKLFELCGM